MNCESCRWYEFIEGASLGHCHKNPPVIFGKPDGDYMSDFPEVDPDDWCGCWSPTDDALRQRYSTGEKRQDRM